MKTEHELKEEFLFRMLEQATGMPYKSIVKKMQKYVEDNKDAEDPIISKEEAIKICDCMTDMYNTLFAYFDNIERRNCTKKDNEFIKKQLIKCKDMFNEFVYHKCDNFANADN